MTTNKLKLNDSKTEVLVIVPKSFQEAIPNVHIRIGDALVESMDNAKNIGVVFDRSMTLDQEIVARCKTCMYHMRNIRAIRRFLTQDACEQLVHALISSRLNYPNATLAGLPKSK